MLAHDFECMGSNFTCLYVRTKALNFSLELCKWPEAIETTTTTAGSDMDHIVKMNQLNERKTNGEKNTCKV